MTDDPSDLGATPEIKKRPGFKYVATVPAGTTLVAFKSLVIAVCPTEPPKIVTPDGLEPLE